MLSADWTRLAIPARRLASESASAIMTVASIPMKSAVARSMPSAPGARPRKMLPPPITTPISTPRRETCATSETMFRIVCRLMPYGSSPIRASPESLRRILLYLGVTTGSRFAASALWLMGLPGLGHDLGGEVGGFLLDPFSNDEESISGDLRLLGREHFLHRLLIVLHERLSHERDLAQELVQRALHHLGRDVGGLARFLRARELDVALARDDIRRHFGFRHMLWFGKGNVHRHVLADLVRPFIVHQDPDLRTVQIKRELAFGLQALEAPYGKVLPDLLDQGLSFCLHLRAEQIQGTQFLRILGIAGGDDFRERLRKSDEILVLRHEVGLGVELDQRSELAVCREPGSDHAFSRDTARRFGGLGAAPDAQQLFCFFQVPIRFGEGFFAFHESQAGELAELFHQSCADFGHVADSLLTLKKRGTRPLFQVSGSLTAPYFSVSSSSTSTNSSREAATTSSRDWVRPSRTASAMPRA